MPYLRVRIEGAGLAGLACAWGLVRAGAGVAVRVVDVAVPGRGASWAAAGMIAPGFEAAGSAGHHRDMLALALRSAGMWPEFARELEAVSGLGVGYRALPTLALARTPEEAERLARIAAGLALAGQGALAQGEGESALRLREPALAEGIGGGLVLESDMQVDARALVQALLVALERLGVAFGAAGDRDEPADAVILAHGWQTTGLGVVPVKGQLMAIRRQPGHPEHVLRAGGLYVVPKADRVLIGASVEPGRSDRDVDEGLLDTMRERACRLCPALAHGEVVERWAGVRPVTRDGAPVLGRLKDGRYIAAGHGRNGVLLAPVTSAILSALVLDGKTDELARRFGPLREGLEDDDI
jgi:glycine oxidase